MPHACAPSAWSLEFPNTPAFRIPLCGLLVGRSTQCDMVLEDPEASRRHAQFLILDSKPWVVDLASTNGILVNSHIVRRERLSEGAIVLVGETRILVRLAHKEDLFLPAPLFEAWHGSESGSAHTKTERLRRLAGAETCAWVEGSHPVFHWPENGCWEDLGPTRKPLLQDVIG